MQRVARVCLRQLSYLLTIIISDGRVTVPDIERRKVHVVELLMLFCTTCTAEMLIFIADTAATPTSLPRYISYLMDRGSLGTLT